MRFLLNEIYALKDSHPLRTGKRRDVHGVSDDSGNIGYILKLLTDSLLD
ncbi:hypothetical protein [Chryseobacterium sp. CH1]|nr:hypothetical protein [Chryseobacterium sp. CH1]